MSTAMPSLLALAKASGWYQDGVDTTDIHQSEPAALFALESLDWSNLDVGLVTTIATWSWAFDEDMREEEAAVIAYIADHAREASDILPLLVELPWIADGIGYWESNAVGEIHHTVTGYDTSIARDLVTAPWVVDGVTFMESLFGIPSLNAFATEHGHEIYNIQDGTTKTLHLPAGPALARQMMHLLGSPPTDRELVLLDKLNTVRRHAPERFTELLTEPWFVDGLDARETIALIAASTVAPEDPGVEVYSLATTTITAPHSGAVHLWVVWRGASHTGQAVLRDMEKAVQESERVLALPFPVNDVIVFLEDTEECLSMGSPNCRGQHLGQVMLLFTEGGNHDPGSLYHEVAHYYFNVGPSWFSEGAAEYLRLYFSNDGNVPAVPFPAYCAEQGVVTLQALNDLGGGPLWDVCRYGMGLHFLAALREAMGVEAWLSAMQAYYRHYGAEGVHVTTAASPDDADMYRLFMEHAPPERVGAVRDIFRQLHGESFVDTGDRAE